MSIGRRIAVSVSAFALRRGLSDAELRGLLVKAFPHRDAAWRNEVTAEAREKIRARDRRNWIP